MYKQIYKSPDSEELAWIPSGLLESSAVSSSMELSDLTEENLEWL